MRDREHVVIHVRASVATIAHEHLSIAYSLHSQQHLLLCKCAAAAADDDCCANWWCHVRASFATCTFAATTTLCGFVVSITCHRFSLSSLLRHRGLGRGGLCCVRGVRLRRKSSLFCDLFACCMSQAHCECRTRSVWMRTRFLSLFWNHISFPGRASNRFRQLYMDSNETRSAMAQMHDVRINTFLSLKSIGIIEYYRI